MIKTAESVITRLLKEFDNPDNHSHQRVAIEDAKDFLAAQFAQPAQSDELTIEDYKEVIESHKALVRELDVLINGKNAAKQASLCDIVAQLKTLQPAQVSEAVDDMCDRCGCEMESKGVFMICPSCKQ